MTALAGWVPFRVRIAGGEPVVDWVHAGDERFTAPFFSQTIGRLLRQPFNQLFVQETPMAALLDRHAASPGLRPTVFIFHGSRCGSTLVAQMSAAMPQTIVISEAPPVDHVLRAPVPEGTRVLWLRALMSALAQPRAGDERCVVVKLDAWHSLQMGLVRAAFPGVPSVFLYRDPVAVVASQLRMPGLQMVPGSLDPSAIGLDLAGAQQLDRGEYASRVLAAIYGAAAAEAAAGRVTLMNYAEFPAGAVAQVLGWCQPTDLAAARARLQDVTRFDAKTPSLSYDPAATPAAALSARALDLVARYASPSYAKLEAIRLAPADQ